MENLFYNISQVLGITIIHSLWQGLIIYMVLSLLLQFMVDKPASVKYKMAFTSLGVMLAWFVYTLYTEVGNYNFLNTILPAHVPPVTDAATALMRVDADQLATVPIDRYYFLIAGYLPYITMLYLAGLVFNTLKMAFAWNNIYRIRQQITQAGFQDQVNQLSKKLGIGRFVRVAFSEYIDVPCITGFLKPLILLPCAISSYLTAEEIKAILLHELAHIRRNDYLLNLLQQAIGILLFFNPFSRLINKVINRERENCCDDMVVHTTGTPLVYAQALLKLEQNKQQDWQLALAATGKKYHLLNRIERIMKTKKTTVNIRPVLIALVLLTCSLSSIAWFNPKIENGKVSVKSIPNPLINTELFSDTTKGKAKAAKAVVKTKPATKKMSKIKREDESFDDAKLEKLAAEAEKHAQALEQYYNGPEFKKMQEEMEKKSVEMEAYYNNPKMKELQEAMEKKSAEFEKMNNSPEIKKLQAELEANSKKIEAYYSSPEYLKIQKDYEKEAELFTRAKPGSDEYKKREAEFKKLAGKFKDYANNPAMKQQAELSKKLAEQARSYYQSPEFVKQRDEMRAYGDSMRKAYQNPMIKEQQETMRKMGQSMRDYQNSPEIKREKEELRKVQQEMRAYRSSPEYRKKRVADIESASQDIKEQVRKEMAEAREYEKREVRERSMSPERTERPVKARKMDSMKVRERAVAPERTRVPMKTRKADTARVRERSAAPVKSKEPETAAIYESKVAPQMLEVAINHKYDEMVIDQPARKRDIKRKDKIAEVRVNDNSDVKIDEVRVNDVVVQKHKPGK
ncbi:MAG: M56 family metallopeptidase [Bacteroidota bacterium]